MFGVSNSKYFNNEIFAIYSVVFLMKRIGNLDLYILKKFHGMGVAHYDSTMSSQHSHLHVLWGRSLSDLHSLTSLAFK